MCLSMVITLVMPPLVCVVSASREQARSTNECLVFVCCNVVRLPLVLFGRPQAGASTRHLHLLYCMRVGQFVRVRVPHALAAV